MVRRLFNLFTTVWATQECNTRKEGMEQRDEDSLETMVGKRTKGQAMSDASEVRRWEMWASIPGYDGYEASNMGRIRSFRKQSSPVVLKLRKNSKGYLYCHVYSNKKRKAVTAHRLVSLAFFGQTNLVTNHINGVKTDNRLENLELCTAAHNTLHAYDMGLNSQLGESHASNKLRVKDVESILKSSDSGANLARKYGVSENAISLIRKGVNWRRVKEKLEAIKQGEGT